MVDVQDVIFTNLLANEIYARSVTPYLKSEYFTDRKYKVIFEKYEDFLENYNALPTVQSLTIEVEKESGMNHDEMSDMVSTLDSYNGADDSPPDTKWLIDETEKFCQDRAIFLAVHKTISIMNGEEKELEKGMIPDLLSTALGVSFDSSIGHSYFADADARFEFYHKKENRLPFGITMFDKVTKGGLPSKTLNIFMGGTGTGKSLVMCHFAANYLLEGKDVLYITLELAEERVAERIDANLLNVPVDDLIGINKPTYMGMLDKIKEKTTGNLVIKEYPTAGAHAGHFRHLLREMKMKKNFSPDVIIVDYLNICSSSRLRAGGNINSYTLVKSIAEELRGLAIEFNVPVISATQTNRDGFGSSDISLTNTSESFGLPATADTFFGIIVTEDLQKNGQMIIKQLKNRFSDISQDSTFVIGVDRPKMRLFDIDSGQCHNDFSEASSGTPNFLHEQKPSGNKFSDFQI